MATRRELEEFAKLPAQRKLDAAFNAGAGSLQEAQSFVAELDNQAASTSPQAAQQVQAQAQQPQGFFSNLVDTVENLSPEQQQGLLAFGADLLNRSQQGGSLAANIANAAQTGFGTTAALRAQRAKAAGEAQKQRLALVKAAQEARKIGNTERGLSLDERKFERLAQQDPRLGKVNPRDFTPASLARFTETGNMADLVFNPKSTSSTSVNVNTGPNGEERIPLSKPEINRQQKQLASLQDEIVKLGGIGERFSEDFLTIGGRLKAGLGGFLDKAGLSDTELSGFNAERSAFTAEVEQFFQAYRSRVTGAAAAVAEMELLREDFLTKDLGPAEFKAKFKSFTAAAKRGIKEHSRNLREGLTPGPTVEPALRGDPATNLTPSGNAGALTAPASGIIRFERDASGQIKQVQ